MHPTSPQDRKSTRLNSSHLRISYAVFCLKKKKTTAQDECPHTTLSAGRGETYVLLMELAKPYILVAVTSTSCSFSFIFFFFLKNRPPPKSPLFPPPALFRS